MLMSQASANCSLHTIQYTQWRLRGPFCAGALHANATQCSLLFWRLAVTRSQAVDCWLPIKEKGSTFDWLIPALLLDAAHAQTAFIFKGHRSQCCATCFGLNDKSVRCSYVCLHDELNGDALWAHFLWSGEHILHILFAAWHNVDRYVSFNTSFFCLAFIHKRGNYIRNCEE